MSLGGVLPSVTMRCPNCRSTHLRRSKWHRHEGRWLSLIYSPYRCEECEKRFLKLSHRFETTVVWSIAGLALVAAIVAVIYTTSYEIVPDPMRTAVPLSPSTSAPAVAASSKGPPGSMESLRPYAKAVAGDVHAQYELGLMLLNGEYGATKNHAQALKWLETAAKGGSADAGYTLGIMYQKGQGALQNFELALQWFESAAAQNHAGAQYQAAMMHRNGMSVAANYVKAYTLANLAAVQGHVEAMTLRDNLLAAMTPAQVAEGQRASREWKPSEDKSGAAPAAPASK